MNINGPSSASASKPLVPASHQRTGTLYRGKSVEISPSELNNLREDLQNNISLWQGHQTASWSNEWKECLEETEIMLSEMYSSDGPLEKCFAHFWHENPVALMVLNNNINSQYANIEHIVSHPGVTGAASFLIEQAVNQSVTWGYDGNLRLSSISEDASLAYENMGFINLAGSGPGEMLLFPADSPEKWQQEGSCWKLKQNSQTTHQNS